MDMLEYWEPSLDAGQFKQGQLVSEFWNPFLALVRLCHAFKHWDDATTVARRARPPPGLYPETRYGKAKRKQEWLTSVRQLETHKHRAAYLAAEKLGEIVKLFEIGSSLSPKGPEWKCYLALKVAIEPSRRRNGGHYCAAAFEHFDANEELIGDPVAIAQRWRAAVGDPLYP